MIVTNTLAEYGTKIVTVVNAFIMQDAGVSIIRLNPALPRLGLEVADSNKHISILWYGNNYCHKKF